MKIALLGLLLFLGFMIFFSRSLRLWQDSNHNGYCEPSELLSLNQFGILNIELKLREIQIAV